eukprot:TRINITY_DN24145_c0_g2_i3.p1 TRINITY_DN24145_c0_g2~~TRINITY_DN24145_c0_g2_i3.p1  ORF type:complete len:273 (+),score=47.74 TRINITY_DN24145_c0_g2_i3:215-1033(+)
MWALFISISGGISWKEVVEPLEEVWYPLIFLFSFYITFTIFAMLNVITGVFCESAIASARTDAEMASQEHMLHKAAYMERVKKLFNTIDQDGKDVITYHELEAYLADEQAAGFFAALDIDISDVWTLFKLLDDKESRVIDIEEFVGGCCRLKGEARSIDVALMSYEHKLFRRRVFKFMTAMEAKVDKLCNAQKNSNAFRSSFLMNGSPVSPRSPAGKPVRRKVSFRDDSCRDGAIDKPKTKVNGVEACDAKLGGDKTENGQAEGQSELVVDM